MSLYWHLIFYGGGERMSRLTVYFLFWVQLFVLIASAIMTGINSALGSIDNSIVWGLVTLSLGFCEFLVFREMLNKTKPKKRNKPKPQKIVDLDPCGPSA